MIRSNGSTANAQTRSASPTQAKDRGPGDGNVGGDDDGILFGDRSERRVFFPGSNKRNAAVAVNVHGSHRRTGAGTDPLSALGLLRPSPYVVLQQNAPAPAISAQEESDGRARGSKSPTHQQHHSQRPSSRAVAGFLGKSSQSSIEPPRITAAATSGHGGHHISPYHGSSREAISYEDIYSPQRPRRSRGRRRRRADVTQGNSNRSASEESFGEDESVVLLLQKIRADEKATLDEAARLRTQPDARAMIRRFWRRSG